MSRYGDETSETHFLPTKYQELKDALEPLAEIADMFDSNDLDDEARKFWGKNQEHECKTPHKDIILYSGRGGKELLTLEDCMKAREILRKL